MRNEAGQTGGLRESAGPAARLLILSEAKG